MKRTAIVTVLTAALVTILLIVSLALRNTDEEPTPHSVTVESISPDPVAETASTTPEEPQADPAPSPSTAIEVTGVVEGAAGVRVPNAVVEAEWRTGEQSATADDDGRFTIRLPRNTFAEGALVFLRKVDYEGRTYDVPFRGKVAGDTLTGYLDSRLGDFPVKGRRAGEGDGALGIWEVVLTYSDDTYPGILNINRRPDGQITGTWDDDLGPAELVELIAPEKVTLSAKLDPLRAFPEEFDVPAEGRNDVVLSVIATGSIEGQVIDSNGEPQSGWTVYARGDKPAPSTKSDHAGSFLISGLEPGSYQLYAAPPEYGNNTDRSEEIVVRPGERVTGVTLLHYLGQSLFGTVFSSDGTPLQGAWVSASIANTPIGADQSRSRFSIQSDVEGRYELAGIPEQLGVVVNMSVNHQNHMQESRHGVVVDGASKDFVLVKNPLIEGVVLDAETREPITEYRMHDWVGDGPREDTSMDLTSRRELESHPGGRFSYHADGYNELRIAVSAPGYLTGVYRLSGIAAGERVGDIEILLQPTDPLTGIVVNEDDSPIHGARIYLGYPLMVTSGGALGSEGVTETGADGRFTIPEYSERLSIISAYHPEYAPKWIDVVSLRSPIKIQLSRGARVEGHVTYGDVPLPAPRAFISVVAPDGFNAQDGRPDENGRYVMENVPTAGFTLQAGFHEGGLRRYIHREIKAQTDGTVHEDFDFSDQFDSYLEGMVFLNEQIVPLALLRAIVTAENGDVIYYQTTSDADGSYRLGPIPATTFEFGALWIGLADGAYLDPTFETVSTRPGETTPHDLRYAD